MYTVNYFERVQEALTLFSHIHTHVHISTIEWERETERGEREENKKNDKI